MAETGRNPGKIDHMRGVVFHKETRKEHATDAEPAKVEVEIAGEKDHYGELRKEWEKKNELLRVTEALGRFTTEGGEELVAVFGAEKVGAALDAVLAGGVDERTGLYMVVRKLEPNLKKRQAVYGRMLKMADKTTKAYDEGYALQKSAAERKAYRDLHGGDFAPTTAMGTERKLRIREYQLYDRASFSFAGGVADAIERVLHGKSDKPKWALQQLKGKFSRAAFVSGVTNFDGSVTKWVSLRAERVARKEAELEAKRVESIDALGEEYDDRLNEIRQPFTDRIEGILESAEEMFGNVSVDDLAVAAPDLVPIMKDFEEKIIALGEKIKAEAAEVIRNELGGYSKQIEKLNAFDVFKDE